MCDNEPDDAPDVVTFRQGEATARKHHACNGCPGGFYILPGERYSYHVGLLDGEFEVWRQCMSAKAQACCKQRPAKDPPAPEFGPDDIPF